MTQYVYIYTKALLHALSFWLLPAEISEKEQGAHPILVKHHHLHRPTRPSKKPATGLISGRGGWVNPNCVMQQPCTCMPTAGHKTYTKALLHALSFWLLPAEISEKEQGAHPNFGEAPLPLEAKKAIQETSHRPDLTPLPCAPIWRSG